ncbi:MAG: hypothetical protein ACXVLF_16305 [Flavisolibacter sp.]
MEASMNINKWLLVLVAIMSNSTGIVTAKDISLPSINIETTDIDLQTDSPKFTEKEYSNIFVKTYTPPPGFSDPGGNPPILWDPTPGDCSVVYAPGLTMPAAYHILGVRNPLPNDVNYFFYFPQQKEVLSFIDPTARRVYAKDVLDGSYGITLVFNYPGGFPPGFNSLALNAIFGTITTPIKGDKYTRVLTATWPFIRRSLNDFNIPQYCSFNKSCLCIRY